MIPQVDVHDYIFQVIAAAGGVLVKVGSTESCPIAVIEAALDDDTAAVVHYLGKQTLEQLAEVVAVAEPRGIPVIVDAAAQLPPRSNLTEPVRFGAGMVVFSGGVPRVRIELLGDRTADVYGAPLRDGEPSIFMGGWDGGMFVDPMTLQPGEAQQVARRLREVLT